MATEPIVKSPSGRPTRQRVGPRNILTIPDQEPGYKYRVVTDRHDRVEQFKGNGWELVENVEVGDKRIKASSTGSPTRVSVGGGEQGYVMRIKEDWYNEDQAAKAKQIDESEEALKNPALDGSYGSVKITRE